MAKLRSAALETSNRVQAKILDQTIYSELVGALYSTPKSILAAALAAIGVTVIAHTLSGDSFYIFIATAFAFIGIWRSGASYLYFQRSEKPRTRASVKRWEFVALIGAWAFSALVGVTGAYTTVAHPGQDVEYLITGCVMGYIAGISSRNASRPIITIGQISLTCVPFCVALLLHFDLVHVTLALFIATLYMSTILISRTVFENIVARHYAYKQVERVAQQDALTGVWSRDYFLKLLSDKISHEVSNDNDVVLITIDLDRFKDINDTLGHPAGDSILFEAAQRIKAAISVPNEVSRVGGDEFLVILTKVDAAGADAIANQILEKLSRPFKINMSNISCGASIGFAIAPRDGYSVDLLLRHADLALYEAKRLGRGRVVAYSAALSREYEKRLMLEKDLQVALDNDELELRYQPIVDPRSGRTICCEALLRWHHPTLGEIPPSIFVPIAEGTGLISRIGSWVLVSACAEAMLWSPDITVAVNLSPLQFKQGQDIVNIVTEALRSSGLAARRLELEITETVLIEDTEQTLAILEELREIGIGISLDDFGTGFASLAYLNDFPFSKVKIDRKFTQNVERSTRTAAILKGIVQTAKDLQIELVAEGVEKTVQLDYMRNLGVNAIQGYLFSRPLRAMRLRRVISKPIIPSWSLERSGREVSIDTEALRAAIGGR